MVLGGYMYRLMRMSAIFVAIIGNGVLFSMESQVSNSQLMALPLHLRESIYTDINKGIFEEDGGHIHYENDERITVYPVRKHTIYENGNKVNMCPAFVSRTLYRFSGVSKDIYREMYSFEKKSMGITRGINQYKTSSLRNRTDFVCIEKNLVLFEELSEKHHEAQDAKRNKQCMKLTKQPWMIKTWKLISNI